MGIASIIWFILGTLLFLLEIAAPGLIVIFFGLGAIATGLVTLLFGFISSQPIFQVLIWVATSAATLGFFRKWLAPIVQKRLHGKEVQQDAIGEHVLVVEDISPHRPGRIKYQGTTWTALSYSETIPAGETVQILDKENLTFIVTRSLLD